MIPAGARLHIERIALCKLLVIDTNECYPAKFATYLQVLQEHPHEDVDPLLVIPSEYEGLYTIYNGKHRFCASVMAGRTNVLCIIIQQGREL